MIRIPKTILPILTLSIDPLRSAGIASLKELHPMSVVPATKILRGEGIDLELPKDTTSRKPRLLIEENQIAHPVLGFCAATTMGTVYTLTTQVWMPRRHEEELEATTHPDRPALSWKLGN
jgi:hypothetical protein